MLYKILETPQGGMPLSYLQFDPVRDRLLEKVAYADGVKTKDANISSLTPDMQEFILKEFKPDPGYCYLVINALSDEETFGFNVNGDAMPRYTKHGDPLLIHDGESHGYKTYELYGHWFHHHQNRDPSKAAGFVLHSSYDVPHGLVRVIVGIERDKDPETCANADRGIMPLTSMGLKVAYDLCTVCAKEHGTRNLTEDYIHEWFTDNTLKSKYPTPGDFVLMHNSEHIKKHGRNIPGLSRWTSEYCEHLRYKMGSIDDTGFATYAVNHLPKLFDISKVFVNADKISQGLFKLANGVHKPYGGIIGWDDLSANRSKIFVFGIKPEYLEKNAASYSLIQFIKGGEDTKEATIEKEAPTFSSAEKLPEKVTSKITEEISPIVKDMDAREKANPLPESFMSAACSAGGGPGRVAKVLSSLTSMRIFPQPQEFQRIILSGLGLGEHSNALDKMRMIFTGQEFPEGMLGDLSSRFGPVISSCMRNSSPDPDLIDNLIPSLSERSLFPQFYYPRARRTIIMIKSGNQSLPIGPISANDIPPSNRIPMSLLESMGVAALAYPLASKIFGNKSFGMDTIAKINPIAMAALLAAGVGGTLLERKYREPEVSLEDAMAASNAIVKTSGVAEFLPWSENIGKAYLGALATMPVIHGYSTYLKNKAMRGEGLGDVERFVALNPDMLSLGYLAAGPVAFRGGKQGIQSLLGKSAEASLDKPLSYLSGSGRPIQNLARNITDQQKSNDPIEKMKDPFDWKDRLVAGATWGMMTPGAFIPGFVSGLVDTEFFHRLFL